MALPEAAHRRDKHHSTVRAAGRQTHNRLSTTGRDDGLSRAPARSGHRHLFLPPCNNEESSGSQEDDSDARTVPITVHVSNTKVDRVDPPARVVPGS